MRNLGTLYRFELKKLCQRKMLWIALAMLAAASVLPPVSQVTGSMYVSNDVTGGEDQVWTHYELVQRKRTDPAGLDGRLLDTDLIREAIGEMGYMSRITMPVAGNDNASQTVTVRQADPDETGLTLDGYVIRGEYGDIYDTLVRVMGQGNMEPDLTDRDYYAAVDAERARAYQYWGLTEDERAWWAERTEKIETPLSVTGYPDGGWTSLAETAYVGDLFIFLFATVALAGLFPMERQRRTDALLQCARNGKAPLYAAKFLAGLTVSFCGGLVILGVMAAGCLILLGPEDAATAVQQLMDPIWGAPMTVRKLAVTVCAVYLAASLVHAAFVMAVSLCTKGGTAAMAVCFGAMMLFIMVPVLPLSHPRLSHVWSLLPAVIGSTGFFDPRMVRLGGYLTNLQAAPLLWLALTLALAGLGLALHRRTPGK